MQGFDEMGPANQTLSTAQHSCTNNWPSTREILRPSFRPNMASILVEYGSLAPDHLSALSQKAPRRIVHLSILLEIPSWQIGTWIPAKVHFWPAFRENAPFCGAPNEEMRGAAPPFHSNWCTSWCIDSCKMIPVDLGRKMICARPDLGLREM